MNRKIILLILLAFSLFPNPSFSQSKDEMMMRQVLQNQQNAWNSGSLEKFMKGYWENDSLMFIGKSGITHGWKKTLENYKKGYPDTAAMGKLAFEILELKPLCVGYYFIAGKWRLQRSIGNLEGHFTLLFHKLKDEWVIVADHSS